MPSRGLEDIACHMAVLTHIITELRHRILRFIRNPVLCKYPGVHPDTVPFSLQNQQLSVRTDDIQIFLCEDLPLQVFPLQNKSVTLFPGIAFHIPVHKIQRFLPAGAHNIFSHIHVGKTDARRHMNMAVNNTRHDELPAEIRDLALIILKSRLTAHIDEFSVLHHKSGCLRTVFVRREDLSVFDNHICFHVLPPSEFSTHILFSGPGRIALSRHFRYNNPIPILYDEYSDFESNRTALEPLLRVLMRFFLTYNSKNSRRSGKSCGRRHSGARVSAC